MAFSLVFIYNFVIVFNFIYNFVIVLIDYNRAFDSNLFIELSIASINLHEVLKLFYDISAFT